MTKTGSSNASGGLKKYDSHNTAEALTGTTASSNLRKTSGSDRTGSQNALANTMSSGGGLTRATAGSSMNAKNMLPVKSQGTIAQQVNQATAKSNSATQKKQFSMSYGTG